MSIHYTGIGSRETPGEILQAMESFAADAGRGGLVLRSGGAIGADSAFEAGAKRGEGAMQIFLPWPYFGGSDSPFRRPTFEAMQIAGDVHPAWDRLSRAVKLLHGRNAHQVLGPGLDEPSDFVACWTPDGALNESSCGRSTGGTATAIRVASRNRVPVLNLRDPHCMGIFLKGVDAVLEHARAIRSNSSVSA
jgi:hypothetical protein